MHLLVFLLDSVQGLIICTEDPPWCQEGLIRGNMAIFLAFINAGYLATRKTLMNLSLGL